MKVLSIIAQKPSSTGSGVYLTELVKCFKDFGAIQEIICGVYNEDKIDDEEGIKFNKVIFNIEELPIKIAGMSDVMPYESIKYSDFIEDDNKLNYWVNAFRKKVTDTLVTFCPDLIICHHLYLLTAHVVNIVEKLKSEKIISNCKIYGICHNTDLRQFRQTDLEREFIKENIKKLDMVFAPSEDHASIAKESFDLDDNKIKIIGIGYNNKIFYNKNENREKNSIIYVGKVAYKKGVMCLVRAINLLNNDSIVLDIVGGAGDKQEYDSILTESKKSKSTIRFLGEKSQMELADLYNKHNIFILPSFSEGIPIVPLEALACGCKVIISDLPGVRDFLDKNVKGASINYVTLPELSNVDEAEQDELSQYEERLATAIKKCLDDYSSYSPSLSNVSWINIAKSIYYNVS